MVKFILKMYYDFFFVNQNKSLNLVQLYILLETTWPFKKRKKRRGGSRTPTTCETEFFVILVNG